MAGAIAGTAILNALSVSDKLKTITVTINNNCNLSCSHCYLQYEKKNFLLKDPTIDSIFNADFEHLAIVGKEPLVNRSSIDLLETLIEKCYLKGVTISIITNGIGLINLKSDLANKINYIDVSFDGGPESYSLYRKSSFFKIIESINNIQLNSNVVFNGLHTISTGTIDRIDDMVSIKGFANFKHIMFSPYLNTIHHGKNEVSVVSIEKIFSILTKSILFNETQNAFLLLDTYHLQQEGISDETIEGIISLYQLNSKIKLIKKDPLDYGVIRVTYDDYILTPYESIHPKNYHKAKHLASNTNLNDIFQVMKSAVKESSL